MLEYLLITPTLKLQCWDDHAARSWVTDLSYVNDDKERQMDLNLRTWFSSFGELDSWLTCFLFLVETGSIYQAHWARIWVLLLMLSLQRELMLKGICAVPQSALGRVEGRGMPYRNYNGRQENRNRINK